MNPTPEQLKDALISTDYRLLDEDDRTWMVGMTDDDPLMICKSGQAVSNAEMGRALVHARGHSREQRLQDALSAPMPKGSSVPPAPPPSAPPLPN